MSWFKFERISASHSTSYSPSPKGALGAYQDVEVKFVVYGPRAPGSLAAAPVLNTYVCTGSWTVVKPPNSWQWLSPNVSFNLPLNASFDLEIWCEKILASSKRIYGTQLSYLAQDQTVSLSWKLHSPATTGTLTGDLQLDVVRKTSAPTPAAQTNVTIASPSLSSSPSLTLPSGPKLSLGTSMKALPTPKSMMMTSSDPFADDMSSNFVPPAQLPPLGLPVDSRPKLSMKPSVHFGPMDPTATSRSVATIKNEWGVKMPLTVEMSLAPSKTICSATMVGEGAEASLMELNSIQMPVGLVNTRFLRADCSTFGALAIAEDSSLYYWARDSDNQKFVEGGPVPALAGKTVVDIAAGHDHYLALTIEGDLFAWGSNQFNQCSPDPRARIQNPAKVMAKHILACAAGAQSSMAIDIEGIVWTWGKSQTSVTVPVDPFADARVSNSGDRPRTAPTHHTVVADSLAHGSNAVAKRRDPRRVAEPTMVCLSEPALMVQGSMSTTMGILVARDGSVFAWGEANAICGTAPDAHSPIPVRIPFPKDVKIVRALACDYHAIAQDATGQLWMWGGRFFGGQTAVNAPSAPGPRPVNLGSVVVDFGCSRACSAALTANGEVWFWKAFNTPVKATVKDGLENITGVSHGPSSGDSYFLIGNTMRIRTDSVAELGKMASTIDMVPFDWDDWHSDSEDV